MGSYGDTSNLNYKTQVSLLVSILRNGLKTNGTTTLDNNARKYLKDFLHLTSQNQYYDYIYYKVTDALDNGIPVFMIGKRDNIFNGHAWIADGYLKRRVTKYETFKYCIVEQENNGTITTRFEDIPSTTITSYELLHINWGWGSGNGYNGYYNQNVFDTDKKMVEDENGFFNQTKASLKNRFNYNKNIEIITDIKPR
ncbi:MAG: C10 family peptidase [Bacteroidales bacterium]|nr:C10 family peptidase [Bacteroidales bacterium]